LTIKRRGLTSTERSDLWRRWKNGQSLSDIARALSKPPGSVHGYLALQGGIAPATRRRAARSLSTSEREEISRGLSSGAGVRGIARLLGRSASTVSREISRNGGAARYRATTADRRAWDQGRRPKSCRLSELPNLQRIVATKLSQDWSPEQIAGWLRVNFADDERMQVSHETIYKSLFVQARGVLKKELLGHLRSRRGMRRSKLATTAGQIRGQIIDAVSIRERPPEVDDRAVPGHWEGDLLCGAANSFIATLVERQTRFTMLVKVEGKDTTNVVNALVREVRKLPVQLRKSLTWDRGVELAHHKRFTVATDVQVYFCDPRSPWQRGTNENTNRLLRQYFPDGSSMAQYTQADLNQFARRLNQRPRKTLGFVSPADELQAVLL
jgi:IS30 family transposase